MTCEFEVGSAPRLTCRGANKFLQAFTRRHVPLIDLGSAPPSFRRIGASIGGTPVPIGPAVPALFTKVLAQTH